MEGGCALKRTHPFLLSSSKQTRAWTPLGKAFQIFQSSCRRSGKRFKSSGVPADDVGSNSGLREMKSAESARTPEDLKSFLRNQQQL